MKQLMYIYVMEYYVANTYAIGGNMDEPHTSIVEQKQPETK